MEDARVREILAQCDAVVTENHFVYAKGGHGSVYVNKDAVYPHHILVAELCHGIARHFLDKGVWYDTVIGPEKGGIILAQWVAHHTLHETRAIYAEKVGKDEDGDVFGLTRGYNRFIAGKRVLVVEDILTTGSSVRKVASLVTGADGTVIGAGAICNRGGVTAEMTWVTELYALINVTLDNWPAEECPLCAEHRPMNVQLGKGRQWLETDAGQAWLSSGGSIAT